MALMMSRPWKHPQTGAYYLRSRTPKDLLQKARGRKIALPVNGRATTVTVGDYVKASLGTKDPAEARERHRIASAALDEVWRGFRSGPRVLSQKEAEGLAGAFYRAFAEGAEDNPGKPELWEGVLQANHEASLGGVLPSPLAIRQRPRTSEETMEGRFGEIADALLRHHRINTTGEGRIRLMEALRRGGDQAAEKLKRNAKGDYRPDPGADRFPSVPRGGPAKSDGASVTTTTVSGLFAKWKERKARQGASPRSARRWEPVIRQFVAFLGHDDAARVATKDVIDWREALYDEGRVSADTFRKTNRAALNSVFALGVDLMLLPSNPVTPVKAERSRKVRVRDRGFTDEEARRILKASAMTADKAARTSPWTLRSRRWVPWLCAYSGARVTEMTQLRKQDVLRVEGVDCIRITPEAGSVKSGEFRLVPLHPHMIEQGFLEFVRGAKDGPLFYGPSRKGADPAQRQSNAIATWVRSDSVGVTDPNVQPNHGWRHRFKNAASRAGISDRVSHHITGHAQGNEGNRYGDAEVSTMWEAIKRLPRYEV